MKKMLLGILATILLPMALLGTFHQGVYAAPPHIPLPPDNTPPNLHFCILTVPWHFSIVPFSVFPGHAFVTLTDGSKSYSRGFYPAPGKTGLKSATGVVNDDIQSVGASRWKMCWNVTVDCYTKIATWINQQSDSPPAYQVGGKFSGMGGINCVDWALQAAAENGYSIPINDYTRQIPFDGRISDPNLLEKYFKSIGNENTDPANPTGGTAHENVAYVLPSTEYSLLSYIGAASLCLENASYFASPSYFNATLDAAPMGSYATTVGFPFSFASSVYVNLNETIVAWDFGDGSNGYATLSTSHTYSNPGNYAVHFIAISENTVWSRTGTVTVSYGGVGGIGAPIDKFGLLAPYIGLASTILVVTVATALAVKRVRRRKEKQ